MWDKVEITGEEATARGYRRVSNKYLGVARIDRPDWVDYMAEKMLRSPAMFYKKGSSLPDPMWCDQFRRVYSKDVICLSDSDEFKKVPGSGWDGIGYVPPHWLTPPPA